MTPSRKQKQLIEAFQVGIRASYLIVEALALSPLNLSLNAALMEATKDRPQIGLQIEFVKIVFAVDFKSRCGLGCVIVFSIAHLAFCYAT